MFERAKPADASPEQIKAVVERREQIHEQRRVGPEMRVQIAGEKTLRDVADHQFVRPGPDMRHAEAKAVESYGGRQHEQQPQLQRPAPRRARFECHDRTRRAISSMIFVPWKRPFSMKIVPVSTPAIAPPATNRPGTLVSNVSGSCTGACRSLSRTPARHINSASARYP